MSNKKISELTNLASADSTDLLAIVDTDAAETKKITFQNLTSAFLTAETDPTFQAASSAYNEHIASTAIHFTEASIDHANIQNIGTISHASIDTQLGNLQASTALLVTDSMADSLHRHSELSASDGSPNPALQVNANGLVGIGRTTPGGKLDVDITSYDARFTGDVSGGGTQMILINKPSDNVVAIQAEKTGAVSYPRLDFYNSGAQKMSLTTDGRFVVGGTDKTSLWSTTKFSFQDSQAANDTLMEIYNSATGEAGNGCTLSFVGKETDGTIAPIGGIFCRMVSPDASSTDGYMYFRVKNSNALTLESDTDAYFAANVSAESFTDRTPYFDGNALEELKNISSIDGEIDHATIPEFAKKTKIRKFIDEENGEVIEKETTERDLGAMISILTKAVNELKAEIDNLKDGGVE